MLYYVGKTRKFARFHFVMFKNSTKVTTYREIINILLIVGFFTIFNKINTELCIEI